MKKFKINLLAIIGMMVAVATVAFTAPKEMEMAPTWYETATNGYLVELTSGPQGDCEVDILAGDECAILLNEPISVPTLRANVSDNDIQETAFTKPE